MVTTTEHQKYKTRGKKKMATKAQIARKIYGTALDNLSSGEKAAVTRAFNAQETATENTPVEAEPVQNTDGYVTAEFGRPGVNGVKKSVVKSGTLVGEALRQTGLVINEKKEGIIAKETGKIVMFNEAVTDGALYLIVPGVDSSY